MSLILSVHEGGSITIDERVLLTVVSVNSEHNTATLSVPAAGDPPGSPRVDLHTVSGKDGVRIAGALVRLTSAPDARHPEHARLRIDAPRSVRVDRGDCRRRVA